MILKDAKWQKSEYFLSTKSDESVSLKLLYFMLFDLVVASIEVVPFFRRFSVLQR